ncbi:MAG: hypothetical protein U0997_06685 [Sulfurimicrobium sp.]|nr:hypothetical protein [Sulfurimicrobium sp.]
MMFNFDLHGFFSGSPINGRNTDVALPDATEWPPGQRPNFTGHAWVYLDYPPVIYTPPPAPRLIPTGDFRARFTGTEMAAILVLAYSGAGDVNAAMLLLKLQTTPEIDLDSPEVSGGLAYLASKGCIAAERVDVLLSSNRVARQTAGSTVTCSSSGRSTSALSAGRFLSWPD